MIVGDGNTINTVVNLKEAAQYKKLENEITKLNAQFERTKQKLERYPEDESFQQDLLEIDAERIERQQELSSLKAEVIRLAEDFNRIPINTERLRLAQWTCNKILDKSLSNISQLPIIIVKRGKIAQRRMPSLAIVPNLDVFKH